MILRSHSHHNTNPFIHSFIRSFAHPSSIAHAQLATRWIEKVLGRVASPPYE